MHCYPTISLNIPLEMSKTANYFVEMSTYLLRKTMQVLKEFNLLHFYIFLSVLHSKKRIGELEIDFVIFSYNIFSTSEVTIKPLYIKFWTNDKL